MVVGKKIEDFFSNMGATYDYRESQAALVVPESSSDLT